MDPEYMNGYKFGEIKYNKKSSFIGSHPDGRTVITHPVFHRTIYTLYNGHHELISFKHVANETGMAEVSQISWAIYKVGTILWVYNGTTHEKRKSTIYIALRPKNPNPETTITFNILKSDFHTYLDLGIFIPLNETENLSYNYGIL